VVELPGVDNPRRVEKLLQATAVLQFWETYDNPSFVQYLDAANNALKSHLSLQDTSKNTQDTTGNPLQTSSSSSNRYSLVQIPRQKIQAAFL
jgi:SecD/SecF fusion protein